MYTTFGKAFDEEKTVSIISAILLAMGTTQVALAQESSELYVNPGESIIVPEGAALAVDLERSRSGVARDAGDAAPRCIYAYKEKGAIQVQNDCSEGWRVKVVMRYDFDSICKWVEPGTRTNIGFNPVAKIDKIVLC